MKISVSAMSICTTSHQYEDLNSKALASTTFTIDRIEIPRMKSS